MRQVEIRIDGYLDKSWVEWLGGLNISHMRDETVLAGQVKDQAAFYGLIGKLRDLGVSLISVNYMQQENGNDPPDAPLTNHDERKDILEGNTDDC